MPNSKGDAKFAGRKRSISEAEAVEEHEQDAESQKSSVHMQNQERAYIAASRRTDRSLEARYQSALMASAVHKKRTGKGFRITHEIVQSEDMYEEEEDVYEPATSQDAYRGRTWSQTDAYIAALIARKSGMQHGSGQGQAICNLLFQDFAAQSGQAPLQTTVWDPSSVPQLVQQLEPEIPQTVQQPTKYEISRGDIDFSTGLEVNSVQSFEDGATTDTIPAFIESGLIPDVPSLSDESSSDLSTATTLFDPGCTPETNPCPTPAKFDESVDLRLEDYLTCMDGEGFWTSVPDEPAVGFHYLPARAPIPICKKFFHGYNRTH